MVQRPIPVHSRVERYLIPARFLDVLLRKDRHAWRYLHRWLPTLRPGVDPVALGLPWLTFGAIDWLERQVTSRWRVIELGAGGSTIFLSRRVRELVSVEHNKDWYRRLRTQLGELPHVNLLLEPAEAFSQIILRYPPNYFDFMLVDGGANRVRALEIGAERIRPGGFAMLDNADWPTDRDRLDVLAGYRRTDFRGVAPWNLHGGRFHISTTSVWEI